jgi:hypothetical protein
MKKCCIECRYSSFGPELRLSASSGVTGYCRRYPPAVDSATPLYITHDHVRVSPGDLCGEFKVNRHRTRIGWFLKRFTA